MASCLFTTAKSNVFVTVRLEQTVQTPVRFMKFGYAWHALESCSWQNSYRHLHISKEKKTHIPERPYAFVHDHHHDAMQSCVPTVKRASIAQNDNCPLPRHYLSDRIPSPSGLFCVDGSDRWGRTLEDSQLCSGVGNHGTIA